MQAVILNEKLIEVFREGERKAKEIEKEMEKLLKEKKSNEPKPN